MSTGHPDLDFPFYRDRFGPAQRRRAEALIMVKRMWPVLEPRICVEIAAWIIRGNPKMLKVEALDDWTDGLTAAQITQRVFSGTRAESRPSGAP